MREIKVEDNKVISSVTDSKGVIIDSSDYFSEISGFKREELINKSHNIIRHPDMPKIIFEMMWKEIKQGRNFKGLIKNKTKTGDFYWVITDFNILKKDEENFYQAIRAKPTEKSIKRISFIYERLINEEKKKNSTISSRKILEDIIYTSGYDSYNEFIEYLSKIHN